MEISSSDITITCEMYFLEPPKLESNSGRAKRLAVVEYVILICISIIVRREAPPQRDCGSAGAVIVGRGRQTGGENSIKPVLAVAICLHVSLYHSAVSIHLRYN